MAYPEAYESNSFFYLLKDYWGDKFPVARADNDIGGVRPFDTDLAQATLADFLSDSHRHALETCITGYNFFLPNFRAGSIIRYDIEWMKVIGETTKGDYHRNAGIGIVVPASYGKGLFTAAQGKDGIVIDRVRFSSEPLIVGHTTTSRAKNKDEETMERLNSLEVFDSSADFWEAERERRLKTFRGRLKNIIQG